jgi:hypothetical protein
VEFLESSWGFRLRGASAFSRIADLVVEPANCDHENRVDEHEYVLSRRCLAFRSFASEDLDGARRVDLEREQRLGGGRGGEAEYRRRAD